MNQPEKTPFNDAESGDNITDPKTGKTISRKKAAIMAIGSAMAGSALNDLKSEPMSGDILLDMDQDGTGDTVLSDANADGIYEIAEVAVVEDVTGSDAGQQSWNPATAPMAAAGTVNDEMSFAEAFSSARSELGAGGVFAWHGQYYNTFYAEELNDQSQPVVEYEVTDSHDLEPLEEYDPAPSMEYEEQTGQEPPAGQEEAGNSPGMMAADYNADGVIDEVYVDLNQDGSADAAYADLNEDGVIAEDEVILIHDPEYLDTPETPADPSMMSIDTNMDGIDEVLLVDVSGDQVADAAGIDQNSDQNIEDSEVIILDPEAMEGNEVGPAEVEYSGEVAADMPEDVSEDVLDQMTDDVARLEDNFDEINNWS